MKILVFSDSHGRYANIQKAVNMHPDAQYVLHLGDGITDLDNVSGLPENVFKVNGNFEDGCFGSSKGLPFLTVDIEGIRLFLCHGHRHNVYFSHQNLIYTALENSVDIVLHGHSHIKHNEYIPQEKLNADRKNGLYIFNPGSISRPRDSIYPSFGLIEIAKNGILLSHGIIK